MCELQYEASCVCLFMCYLLTLCNEKVTTSEMSQYGKKKNVSIQADPNVIPVCQSQLLCK